MQFHEIARCEHALTDMGGMVTIMHPMNNRAPTACLDAISMAARSHAGDAQVVRDWPSTAAMPEVLDFRATQRIQRATTSQARRGVGVSHRRAGLRSVQQPSLQVTPIVVDNLMYVSTPLGKVMALEPATGREIWRYDARVNPKGGYGDFANRGVATWVDSTLKPGAPCRRRIYVTTVDARLISLDAGSGYPCVIFGVEGTIGLREGLRIPPAFPSAYQVTSPPVVVNDLVITGSSIADNSRPAPASGEVRAFDARTGALRWNLASDTARPQGSSVRDVAQRQRRANRRRKRVVDHDGGSGARSDVRADIERRA